MDDLKSLIRNANGGDITALVEIRREHVHVEYRGLPADLMAAAAVEPRMIEKGEAGKCQRDSHGDRYRRRMLTSGKLEIVRSVTDLSRARSLPGVPGDITEECIEWLEKHPGKIHNDRRLTTCGSGYWIHDAGTLEALVAAGLVENEKSCNRLLNGYFEYLHYERVPQVQRFEARGHLRLAWSNPVLA